VGWWRRPVWRRRRRAGGGGRRSCAGRPGDEEEAGAQRGGDGRPSCRCEARERRLSRVNDAVVGWRRRPSPCLLQVRFPRAVSGSTSPPSPSPPAAGASPPGKVPTVTPPSQLTTRKGNMYDPSSSTSVCCQSRTCFHFFDCKMMRLRS
jgi:hypothetical protein